MATKPLPTTPPEEAGPEALRKKDKDKRPWGAASGLGSPKRAGGSGAMTPPPGTPSVPGTPSSPLHQSSTSPSPGRLSRTDSLSPSRASRPASARSVGATAAASPGGEAVDPLSDVTDGEASKSGESDAEAPRPLEPKDLMKKIMQAPSSSVATLTMEAWCMSMWEVLGGHVWQQRVWSFGTADGDSGQRPYTSPEPLALVDGVELTSVSAGDYHAAAAGGGSERSSTHVFTWGINTYGQLGIGGNRANCQIVAEHPMDLVSPQAASFKGLFAHLPDTLMQGLQDYASFALDPSNVHHTNLTVYRMSMPAPVAMVACGGAHTLVALQGRGVMGWGDNRWGQVGALPDRGTVDQPVPLPAFADLAVTHLSAGACHSVAILKDSADVWSWGCGSNGQLGTGPDKTVVQLPSLVPSLCGLSVKQVSCGVAHTLALTGDGTVLAWGCNFNHCLGTFDVDDRPEPAPVTDLPPCVSVAAALISMAVSTTGRLYMFGFDDVMNPPSSQRGCEAHGRRGSEAGGTPAVLRLVAWTRPHKVTSIACSTSHAIALTSDEHIYAWGDPAAFTPDLLSKATRVNTDMSSGMYHRSNDTPPLHHKASQAPPPPPSETPSPPPRTTSAASAAASLRSHSGSLEATEGAAAAPARGESESIGARDEVGDAAGASEQRTEPMDLSSSGADGKAIVDSEASAAPEDPNSLRQASGSGGQEEMALVSVAAPEAHGRPRSTPDAPSYDAPWLDSGVAAVDDRGGDGGMRFPVGSADTAGGTVITGAASSASLHEPPDGAGTPAMSAPAGAEEADLAVGGTGAAFERDPEAAAASTSALAGHVAVPTRSGASSNDGSTRAALLPEVEAGIDARFPHPPDASVGRPAAGFSRSSSASTRPPSATATIKGPAASFDSSASTVPVPPDMAPGTNSSASPPPLPPSAPFAPPLAPPPPPSPSAPPHAPPQPPHPPSTPPCAPPPPPSPPLPPPLAAPTSPAAPPGPQLSLAGDAAPLSFEDSRAGSASTVAVPMVLHGQAAVSTPAAPDATAAVSVSADAAAMSPVAVAALNATGAPPSHRNDSTSAATAEPRVPADASHRTATAVPPGSSIPPASDKVLQAETASAANDARPASATPRIDWDAEVQAASDDPNTSQPLTNSAEPAISVAANSSNSQVRFAGSQSEGALGEGELQAEASVISASALLDAAAPTASLPYVIPPPPGDNVAWSSPDVEVWCLFESNGTDEFPPATFASRKTNGHKASAGGGQEDGGDSVQNDTGFKGFLGTEVAAGVQAAGGVTDRSHRSRDRPTTGEATNRSQGQEGGQAADGDEEGDDDADEHGFRIRVRLFTFNDKVHIMIRKEKSQAHFRRGVPPARGGGLAAAAKLLGVPGSSSLTGEGDSSYLDGMEGGLSAVHNGEPGPLPPHRLLDPVREPVFRVACGRLHTVCLTGRTMFTPGPYELREAALVLVHDYARAWRQHHGGARSRGEAEALMAAQAAAAATGATEVMPIDAALLFCREIGLVDNHSEYADLIRIFRTHSRRRHALLAPSVVLEVQAQDNSAADMLKQQREAASRGPCKHGPASKATAVAAAAVAAADAVEAAAASRKALRRGALQQAVSESQVVNAASAGFNAIRALKEAMNEAAEGKKINARLGLPTTPTKDRAALLRSQASFAEPGSRSLLRSKSGREVGEGEEGEEEETDAPPIGLDIFGLGSKALTPNKGKSPSFKGSFRRAASIKRTGISARAEMLADLTDLEPISGTLVSPKPVVVGGDIAPAFGVEAHPQLAAAALAASAAAAAARSAMEIIAAVEVAAVVSTPAAVRQKRGKRKNPTRKVISFGRNSQPPPPKYEMPKHEASTRPRNEFELRIAAMRHLAEAKDAAKLAHEMPLDPSGFVEMLLDVLRLRDRELQHASAADVLSVLAKQHLTHLQHRPPTGVPWILESVANMAVVEMLDDGNKGLILHQLYAYLVSAIGVSDDLCMCRADIQRGLRQSDDFNIPLLRVAQFLRQAGLVPRLLSRLVTQMYGEVEAISSNIPMTNKDSLPWWKPQPSRRQRIFQHRTNHPEDFLHDIPEEIDLMSHNVLVGVCNTCDILGIPIPRSKRDFDSYMNSERHTLLEQFKRDRLLAYIVAHMFGGFLVRILNPFDQRPEVVLGAPVSYPQFLEVIGVCQTLKALIHDPQDVSMHVNTLFQAIHFWRERILFPWKFARLVHSDEDLEHEVDLTFGLFCTIDPLADCLGISIHNFKRIVRECEISDEKLHVNVMQDLFYELLSGKFGTSFLAFAPPSLTNAKKMLPFTDGTWEADAAATGLLSNQVQRLSSSRLAGSVAHHQLNERLAERKLFEIALKEAEEEENSKIGGPERRTPDPYKITTPPTHDLRIEDARQLDALAAAAAAESTGSKAESMSSTILSVKHNRQARLAARDGGKKGSLGRRLAGKRFGDIQVETAVMEEAKANKVQVDLPPDLQLPHMKTKAAAAADVTAASPLRGSSRFSPSRRRATSMRNSMDSPGFSPPRGSQIGALESRGSRRLSGAEFGDSATPPGLDAGMEVDSGVRRLKPMLATWPSFDDSETGRQSAMQSPLPDNTPNSPTTRSPERLPERETQAPPSLRARLPVLPSQRLQDEALQRSGGATETPGGTHAEESSMRRTSNDSLADPSTSDALMPALSAEASLGGYAASAAPLAPPYAEGGGSHLTPLQHLSRENSGGGLPMSPSMRLGARIDGGRSTRLAHSAGGGASDGNSGGLLSPSRLRALSAKSAGGAAIHGTDPALSLSFNAEHDGQPHMDSPVPPPLPLSSTVLHTGTSPERRRSQSFKSPTRKSPTRSSSPTPIVHLDQLTEGWDASVEAAAAATAAGSSGGSNRRSRKMRHAMSVNSTFHQRTDSGKLRSRDDEGDSSDQGESGGSLSVQFSPEVGMRSKGRTSPSKRRASAKTKPAEFSSLLVTRAQFNRVDTPDSEDDSHSVASSTATSVKSMQGNSSPRVVSFQQLMNRELFGELIRRIAVLKYSKISSPVAAWRLLVERHLLPVVESGSAKFDVFLAQLLEPSVMAQLVAWQPQMRALFEQYSRYKPEVKASHRMLTGPIPAPSPSRRQMSSDPFASDGRGRTKVTFVQYLQLCQDRHIIPASLQPQELEEIFRRVNFSEGNTNLDHVQAMGFPQFVDALCLTGLWVYSQPKFRNQFPTAEDRLDAFIPMMCNVKANVLNKEKAQMKNDPFSEWWSLKFNPDSREVVNHWSYMSSANYSPVLLQELIIPPVPIPKVVRPLLSQAEVAHINGDYEVAKNLYNLGKLRWQEEAVKNARGHAVGLLPEQDIYFASVTACVLMSQGKDENAIEELEDVQVVLDRLRMDHPLNALLHNLHGVAHYHLGNLQHAFEHFVQGKVLRDEHPLYGSQHVDSATVSHNLGCVLDRLGKVHKAYELISQTVSVFNTALGSQHPRFITAMRNLRGIKHRCMHMRIRPPGGYGGDALPEDEESTDSDDDKAEAKRARASARGDGTIGRVLMARAGVQSAVDELRSEVESDDILATRLQQQMAEHTRRSQFMSMAERLSAFQLRTRGNGKGGIGSSKRRVFRKATDLDYLGGHIHFAPPDVVAVYEKVRYDIERRALGQLPAGALPDHIVMLPRKALDTAHAVRAAAAATAAVNSQVTPPPGSSVAASAAIYHQQQQHQQQQQQQQAQQTRGVSWGAGTAAEAAAAEANGGAPGSGGDGRKFKATMGGVRDATLKPRQIEYALMVEAKNSGVPGILLPPERHTFQRDTFQRVKQKKKEEAKPMADKVAELIMGGPKPPTVVVKAPVRKSQQTFFV